MYLPDGHFHQAIRRNISHKVATTYQFLIKIKIQSLTTLQSVIQIFPNFKPKEKKIDLSIKQVEDGIH